jgi:hypothetical protein
LQCSTARYHVGTQGELVMTNKVNPILAIAALALGCTCLFLWLQLGRERVRAAKAEASGTALLARMARLETSVHSSIMAATSGTSPVGSLALTAASATPAPTTMTPPLPIKPLELTPSQRRTMTRQQYGKLFRELNLSESQVERVLDVLAAQEERSRAASPQGMARPRSALDPKERERNKQELAVAIGPDNAAKLEHWQDQSIPRGELQRVRDQLENAGEPLTTEQQHALNQRLQQRPDRESPPRREPDEPQEAFQERFHEWRADSRKQLRDDVAQTLTPQQQKRFDELEEMTSAFEQQIRLPSSVSGAAGARATR